MAKAPGKKTGAGHQAKNQRYIGFKVQGIGYREAGDRRQKKQTVGWVEGE